MKNSTFFLRILTIFISLAVILPVSSTLLFILGAILAVFGDKTGYHVVEAAALTIVALWGTDLVALLLTLALDRLGIGKNGFDKNREGEESSDALGEEER